MCRYWGYSGRLYTQCRKHVPFEECYDTIIDVINYVLEKRVWENPLNASGQKNSLYGDPRAADKAFHIVYKRERGRLLANKNAYKRKSDFNTLSIDKARDDYKDSTDGILFNIEDSSLSKDISLIKLISNNDNLKILVLDQICFGNSFRAGRANVNMIINNILNLSDEEIKSLSLLYGVDYLELKQTISNIDRNTIENTVKIMLYNMRREITEIDK